MITLKPHDRERMLQGLFFRDYYVIQFPPDKVKLPLVGMPDWVILDIATTLGIVTGRKEPPPLPKRKGTP